MKHFVTRGRSGGTMTSYPWPVGRPGGRVFLGGRVVEIVPKRPSPPFRLLDPDITGLGGRTFQTEHATPCVLTP